MERERAQERDGLPTALEPQAGVVQGAVAGAVGSGDEQADAVDASLLPLIVWLRGDESWCAQFSLDAEAVMARLAIRRSRLTQISGKELRVGRIRRGRHVVPVYRAVDVEAYLGWARAPATHMKSATALQEATTALERRGEELAAVAAEAPGKVAEAVEQRVRDALRGTTRVLVEAVGALGREIADLSTSLLSANQSRLRESESLDLRLKRLETAADKLAAAALSQSQDVAELAALARLQGEATREALVRERERDAKHVEDQRSLEERLDQFAKQLERPTKSQMMRRPHRADALRLAKLGPQIYGETGLAVAGKSPASARRRKLRAPRLRR